MCTVTYIPTTNGFVLTSSRDEVKDRPTLSPQEYQQEVHTLIYPKDEIAGGTWIAASAINRYACLLNGAFENHTKKKSYRKSRGTILLESFDYSVDTFVQSVDLNDIEPFTLLIIDTLDGVYIKELIWDGEQKHIKEINPLQPYIWSSVTLYDKKARNQRLDWFNEWNEDNKKTPDNNIFLFHIQPHSEESENDILMEREDGLQTVSITQIRHQTPQAFMVYTNIVNQSQTNYPISILCEPDSQ